MTDLRQRKRWSPQQLAKLVEEMARAEVARANYGTGPSGCVLKGEELLKEVIASKCHAPNLDGAGYDCQYDAGRTLVGGADAARARPIR